MIRTTIERLCLAHALVLVALSSPQHASAQQVLEQEITADCLLMVHQQMELSARRDGIIEQLHARMGDQVRAEQIVMELGLQEAIANLEAAQVRHAKSIYLAQDKTKLDSADVDLRRAKEELAVLEEVGQVPYLEVFRADNAVSKAEAELEIAKTEMEDHKNAARITEAELVIAEIDVTDRRSVAPYAGVVSEQMKFQGEWCDRGDAVLKIVRLDQLMLQAIVNIRDLAPHSARGMHASAVFQVAHGEPVQINDLVISRVDAEVDLDGNYVVWTIIENKKGIAADGQPSWFLRPGMSGQLSLPPQRSSDRRITQLN